METDGMFKGVTEKGLMKGREQRGGHSCRAKKGCCST